MASILITGGTGYFGRAFADRIVAQRLYDRVCVFSRDEHKQADMRRAFGDDPCLRWFIGDVRDCARLQRAMEGVDVVVHAAALKRIEVGFYNPDEMAKTNIMGTMNVIEAAIGAGVKKVVFLSSDKAFEPVSPYGQSKAMGEGLILAANNVQARTKFAVTRYGNVAGSTGSVIPTWRAALQRGEEQRITDPSCTRFWMTKDEAVDLVLNAIAAMPTEPMIPVLPAFELGDLALAMHPGDNWLITGLGKYEKRHEAMSQTNRSETARRMTVAELTAALEDVK